MSSASGAEWRLAIFADPRNVDGKPWGREKSLKSCQNHGNAENRTPEMMENRDRVALSFLDAYCREDTTMHLHLLGSLCVSPHVLPRAFEGAEIRVREDFILNGTEASGEEVGRSGSPQGEEFCCSI